MFSRCEEIWHGREADAALAEAGARDDFGLEFVVLSEEQVFADSDFASGRTRHSHSLGSVCNWRVRRTSMRPWRKSRAAGFRWLTGCERSRCGFRRGARETRECC